MMNKYYSTILVSALLLLCSTAQGEVKWLERIVAIAGDDVITTTELRTEMGRIARELNKSDVKIPPQDLFVRQVLERLIVHKLQLQRASDIGIRVDDRTLNRALENIAEENQMDLNRFRQALRSEGIEYNQFRDDIRDELIITKLRRRAVDQTIQVSEKEITDFIEKTKKTSGGNKQYHLAHILIALPEAASPDAVAEAKNKAETVRQKARNGENFASLSASYSDAEQALKGGDLGWIRGNQLPTLFADTVAAMNSGEVSDIIRSPGGYHLVKLLGVKGGDSTNTNPEVEQKHARHILIKTDALRDDAAAQALLNQLLQQIQTGADFATLAKEHSDDPGSAAKGGDLGWTTADTFVPAFQDMVNRLRPGQISQPFQSRFGWHIVELLDQRIAPAPDEMLRSKAREFLVKQKREEALQLWIRKLRDEAYVEFKISGVKNDS